MEDNQKKSKWKTTKSFKKGRRPKKFKMKDDQKNENGRRQKNENGRQPKKFIIEDNQNNSKWKTTKKNQNGR